MKHPFVVTLGLLLAPLPCLAAGNLVDGPDANLVYDWRTGSVVLDLSDLPSNRILSFMLQSRSGFRVEEFNDALCRNNLKDCPGIRSQIGVADLTFQGFEGPVSLGNLFPEGILTADELSVFLIDARYSKFPFGAGGGNFDLIVVPEPSAYGCLAVLFLAALVARRRSISPSFTASS